MHTHNFLTVHGDLDLGGGGGGGFRSHSVCLHEIHLNLCAIIIQTAASNTPPPLYEYLPVAEVISICIHGQMYLNFLPVAFLSRSGQRVIEQHTLLLHKLLSSLI